MTHTPNQSKADEQALKDRLKQIKAEGGARSNRIARILRTAFADSKVELEEGFSAVNPATKEVREAVTQLIQETSRETLSEAKRAWNKRSRPQSQGWRNWFLAEIQTAIRAMRATWSERQRSARTTDETLKSAELKLSPISHGQGDS